MYAKDQSEVTMNNFKVSNTTLTKDSAFYIFECRLNVNNLKITDSIFQKNILGVRESYANFTNIELVRSHSHTGTPLHIKKNKILTVENFTVIDSRCSHDNGFFIYDCDNVFFKNLKIMDSIFQSEILEVRSEVIC